MKSRLALSCAVLFAAGFVYAQEPPSSSTPSQDRDRSSQASGQAASMSSKSTRLIAEVVSTDSTAKTITVRNAAPAESSASAPGSTGMSSDTMTLPVDSKASASLKTFNAGDRVSLTCAKEKAGSYGSSGSSAPGTSGATGTAGTTGTAGAPGSTGSTMGSSSGDFSKLQASCPAVTAIAKVKPPSSSDKP